MVGKVGLNTTEDLKKRFVHTAAGAAGGSAIGLGCAYVTTALGHKSALKDEFKSAKEALKNAKKQNLGEEAVKGAKNTLKELKSKVNKEALGFTKQMVKPAIAAFGAISVLYGLVFPLVNEHLQNKKQTKA